MIYIYKFIYQTFLLPPGIFIISMLLIGFKIFKKQRNNAIALLSLTFIFYLSSTALVSNILIAYLEDQFKPPLEPKGDVIIMLGGGATNTPNLTGNGNLSSSSANRLLTCLQLFNRLKIPIIITGGKLFDDSADEAIIAQKILISLGVPNNKIITENISRSTLENVKFTKAIIKNNNFRSPILVTSAFHMSRSVKLFEVNGISITPYPCDYMVDNRKFKIFNLIPSSEEIFKFATSLKEYIGIITYRVIH
ncbi:MAG: YdcF family protein [Desulfobacterales bacterium]|nr:YdcF family protein [Desulfobacterales bacterium]